MRLLGWTLIIGLLAATIPQVRTEAKSLFEPQSNPRVEAAIDLRCVGEPLAFRDDCARELRHDFKVGLREPEEIVRRRCTRIQSDWAIHTRAPLPICNELYGGWIKG